jgi:hypothetical protein
MIYVGVFRDLKWNQKDFKEQVGAFAIKIIDEQDMHAC